VHVCDLDHIREKIIAKEFYNEKSPQDKLEIKARKIKLEGFYVER
jgi:hypothetical protein